MELGQHNIVRKIDIVSRYSCLIDVLSLGNSFTVSGKGVYTKGEWSFLDFDILRAGGPNL